MSPRTTPRQRRQRVGDGNRWLQTYADAMTLLLAFFVILYAMSEIDVIEFEAFIRGLEVPFGNPATSEGVLDAGDSIVGDVDAPSDPLEEAIRITENLPVDPSEGDADEDEEEDLEGGEENEDEGVDEIDAEQAASQAEVDRDLDQLREVRQIVEESLAEAGYPDVADFRLTERGLVMSISADDVLFDVLSTDIKDEGLEVIDAIATPLEGAPNDVLVEGHTDDQLIARTDYSNWNLSTDRAVAVLSVLFEDYEIGEERLGAAGYGEHRPRVPNDSEENQALNRRVDILVVAQSAD
ncbi:hypothetical protein ER308_17820 [Egibacter rhizosphaerae]|uniref:OmpA-like domain-containing protein n=1 Tax=Egibacter rhizosphaerae TaxID=1670831 RepID=A0A411YIX1_9ACTN|nr:flagellar motor protein MotB [Egibacter rhizosphaerae]QBI21244.1 hypothetical protein ER308_17820 [Egibacter rhizosphaerae]